MGAPGQFWAQRYLPTRDTRGQASFCRAGSHWGVVVSGMNASPHKHCSLASLQPMALTCFDHGSKNVQSYGKAMKKEPPDATCLHHSSKEEENLGRKSGISLLSTSKLPQLSPLQNHQCIGAQGNFTILHSISTKYCNQYCFISIYLSIYLSIYIECVYIYIILLYIYNYI